MNFKLRNLWLGFLTIIIMITMIAMLPSVTRAATVATKKTLYVGETYKFKIKNADKKIRWSTSNPKVASVNQKGKVTAKKIGSAEITAKYGKSTKKYKVKVNHEILKYISKDWYTAGLHPDPPKYRFTNKYIKSYYWNGKDAYVYSSKDKVTYDKTVYGYYITVHTKKGKYGYRLNFEYMDVLELIGNGDPYSQEGYSGSSSLSRD